ncbi:MAG: hypothetical protein ACR2MB_01935 [Acidimicrobiales bacterium]
MNATDGSSASRLHALLDPGTTAVLTMELQQGIVGPGALFPALADQPAAVGLLDPAARLCRGHGPPGLGSFTPPW